MCDGVNLFYILVDIYVYQPSPNDYIHTMSTDVDHHSSPSQFPPSHFLPMLQPFIQDDPMSNNILSLFFHFCFFPKYFIGGQHNTIWECGVIVYHPAILGIKAIVIVPLSPFATDYLTLNTRSEAKFPKMPFSICINGYTCALLTCAQTPISPVFCIGVSVFFAKTLHMWAVMSRGLHGNTKMLWENAFTQELFLMAKILAQLLLVSAQLAC